MLTKLMKSCKSSLTRSRLGTPSNSLPTLPQGSQQEPGATENVRSANGLKAWRDVPNAIVDIVFIHGLGGDRDSTWTAKPSLNPWPIVLLDDLLPLARLLTWGYGAQVRGKGAPISTNRLLDHAKNLMRDLVNDREIKNATSRPLIFVTHSMGGLVCKQAILLSQNNAETHFCDIFSSFSGVIFLGTPHRGSWMADWAAIPASALGMFAPTNKSLLDVLSTNDQLLEVIQTEFLSMLRKQHDEGNTINVVCFFEELPIYRSMVVVRKHSATLDGYDAASIHATHSNMVKFASKEDVGFKRVSAELIRWYSRLQSQKRSQISRHRQRRFHSQGLNTREINPTVRVDGLVAGKDATQLVHILDGSLSVSNMEGGDGVVQSIGSGWVPVTSSIPRPAKQHEGDASSSESNELLVSPSNSATARITETRSRRI